MPTVIRPVSRSVFPCVHRATNVPAALLGGVTPWTMDNLPDDIATDYFAAIASAGGTISAGNQAAVLAMLTSMQSAGLLRLIRCLYLFHGNTLSAAAIETLNPSTNPGSYPITWNGTPTLLSAGGFTATASNYAISAHPDAIGLTPLSGAGMSFYCSAGSSDDDATMGCENFFFWPRKDGAVYGYLTLGNGAAQYVATANTLTGFHSSQRESSSGSIKAFRNATRWMNAVSAISLEMYNNGSNAIRIGGTRISSSHLTSTATIRLAMITRGISEASQATLNTIVQTYIGALA